MRARRQVAAVSLATLLGSVAAAVAADPPAGTLDDPSETVSWQGRLYTTTDAPVPDTFTLTIDLPDGYWDAHDGGVEVAIRWESEYNVFDLYVASADGATFASATGFPTSAESLILREPANGVYHVVVAPTIQIDSDYEGIAQVELDTTRAGPLVPDLVALPPAGIRIASGVYSFMPVAYGETGGCYPDEFAENPDLSRCLRFDAGIANLGHGPFELRLDTATMATVSVVWQDVYNRDGNRVATTDAGTYTFHETHGHIHYENFAEYRLHAVNSDGTPGAEVTRSRKADFCMIDTRLIWFGLPGNGPRNHHFPDCNLPGGDSAGPTEMRQGIDAGWADVYTWDLPGQYIDVSAVPDGVYAVVIEANPAGALSELDQANNVSWTRIRIAGDTASECEQPPPGC